MSNTADIILIFLWTDQLGHKESEASWTGYLSHPSFLQMRSGEHSVILHITAWYKKCSATEGKALQQVKKSAHRTTSNCLPSATNIYIGRYRNRAASILKNPSYLAHGLSNPLPSGRKLRRIRAKTTRVHTATPQRLSDC